MTPGTTQERWKVDRAHSGIRFSARTMVVSKVRGEFLHWSATIFATGNDPSRASVEAIIDASSISTGNVERDAHLKSADFLDVANHPQIRFESTRVEKRPGGVLRVSGRLAIRGTIREIILEVQDTGRTKDPWGTERAGFIARTTLTRKAFGLTWNRIMDPGHVSMVGDDIEIKIEAKAVRQMEVAGDPEGELAVVTSLGDAGRREAPAHPSELHPRYDEAGSASCLPLERAG